MLFYVSYSHCVITHQPEGSGGYAARWYTIHETHREQASSVALMQ
jgi:hypothetical protein